MSYASHKHSHSVTELTNKEEEKESPAKRRPKILLNMN
jgi:hypothetical protein